jgi:hypothetical protein
VVVVGGSVDSGSADCMVVEVLQIVHVVLTDKVVDMAGTRVAVEVGVVGVRGVGVDVAVIVVDVGVVGMVDVAVLGVDLVVQIGGCVVVVRKVAKILDSKGMDSPVFS